MSKVKYRKNYFYTKKFLKQHIKYNFKIIEIHNRPNYFHLIYKSIKKQKIILYFHNDPLTMEGAKTKEERIYLFENAEKINNKTEFSKRTRS